MNPASSEEARRSFGLALLGAFYLAWFYQANFLQRQLDYHQVPPVMLALALLVGHAWFDVRGIVWRVVLGVLVLGAAIGHPLLRPERLALWPRCWTEGASASLRDALALEFRHRVSTNHVELAKVAAYLRSQGVRDRELTCFSLSTLSLYQDLGVVPSTRFLQLNAYLAQFPSHRREILRAVEISPQRFIITDVRDLEVSPEAERGPVEVPARLVDQFPFREPVVFRSGRYLVHRVRPPEARPTPRTPPEPLLIPPSAGNGVRTSSACPTTTQNRSLDGSTRSRG